MRKLQKMSRQYYCSICGMKLTCTRKALRHKSIVIDLITPHTCDNAHLENITDATKPIKPKLVFNDSLSAKEDEIVGQLQFNDRRDPKFQRQAITSTAPANILNIIKRNHPTGAERSMIDLDESDEA